MSKTKNKNGNQDEVPTPVNTTVYEEQKDATTPIFVVIRGGARVSENEYSTSNEPKALDEKAFWQKIVKKFPDGTKVEIVPFDKRKHRIW